MTELWLKFRDESGRDRREPVGTAPFTIGRQPENGLTIPDNRLSRTHLKIDRFGDVFVASDCGSSNGSKINGSELTDPVSLKDGDLILLGGVEFQVELIAPVADARRPRRSAAPAQQEQSGASSIPTALFFIAPLIVVLILVCGGGGLYLLSDDKEPDVVINDPKYPTKTPDDEPDTKDGDPDPSPSVSPSVSPDSSVTPSSTVKPGSDETRRIEENSAKFLRRIALSDPNAFLETPQIEIVKGHVAQLKGSSAIESNLKALKSNATQIQQMAASQGMKPDFVAAAALTKIGNRQGDPVVTAKSMMPFLADLRISLGNSLADDNLLIMADYLRREGGQGRSLQSILEGIPRSKIGGAKPREIRTIWFLRKNDKISEQSYEFALRFIAIGTIMQNPKDFGVNAEPITF